MKDFQISEYFVAEYLLFKKSIDLEILITEFSTHYKFPIDIENLVQPKLLVEAFTHKSFHFEQGQQFPHNERLEFLGDSVLDLVVADFLLKKFPTKSEGEISRLRSAIVNETTLAKLSLYLKIEKYLLLGRGELKENGHKKSSLLANTFEAFIGAVYSTSGLKESSFLIQRIFDLYKKDNGEDLLSEEVLVEFDSKSVLQEMTMKHLNVIPKYIFEEMPGKKLIKVSVEINGQMIDSTTDLSKKKAGQKLAKNILKNKLLDKLFNLNEVTNVITRSTSP